MANKKFSAFSAESNINNFEGLVGFNTTGSLNQKIAPLEMPARVEDNTENVALGNFRTLAGTSMGTAGNKNIAIGYDALSSVDTTGTGDPLNDCIAIGSSALKRIANSGSLATGELIAIGTRSQEANGSALPFGIVPADENVAIGFEALESNQGDFTNATPTPLPDDTGNFNTAIGGKSLEDLNGGTSNTALGHHSGFFLIDGAANTLAGFEVGTNTGKGVNMLNEDGVTAMGWQATSQGSFSVVLGYDATCTTGNGTAPDETIVIGRAATCDVNNSIVIGARSSYTAANAPTSGENVLIGYNTDISDGQVYINGRNTIVGSLGDVTGSYHTHLGWGCTISGEDNNSIGYLNEVHGSNNVSLGDSSSIGSAGGGAINDATNCIAIGGDIDIAGGSVGSMLIGAGTRNTVNNAFEIGFGGSAAVIASNDVILVGAGGGSTATSKLDLGGELTITSPVCTTFNGQVAAKTDIQSTAGGITNYNLNFKNSNIIRLTINGSFTMGAVGPDGTAADIRDGVYKLFVVQGPGAPHVITWGLPFKWPGGTAPTLSTTGGAQDLISFVVDAGKFYGTIEKAFS
tara:strand:+ start:2388 stop:4112 length:1725 start_codon:yes stop_codon:yes gene_type:complete